MHKIIICEKCLKIIGQCRCMKCDKVIEYDICDECKLTEKDIKNANVHQILKTIGI
ncbi:hypothetical protein M0R04_16155 [Candidatus Dojkabacteria bacterium]|jgi:hypothetical protein|nr:hypothetical protein [Candidatus Dojkabacteria bacterium]